VARQSSAKARTAVRIRSRPQTVKLVRTPGELYFFYKSNPLAAVAVSAEEAARDLPVENNPLINQRVIFLPLSCCPFFASTLENRNWLTHEML
jgi:hypothetical protein